METLNVQNSFKEFGCEEEETEGKQHQKTFCKLLLYSNWRDVSMFQMLIGKS
jgi:hypothetical protein